MYVLSMAAVSLACSAAPITFEFCVELSYPVSEGLLGEATQEHCRCCSAAVMQYDTAGNWMTLMFNIPSGLYFGLFQIPGDNITVSTFGSLVSSHWAALCRYRHPVDELHPADRLPHRAAAHPHGQGDLQEVGHRWIEL